jgi:hypothetical protein
MRWIKHLNLRIPRLREPRRAISNVSEVAGLGCLVGAAFWWIPIVGLVSLGLVLLLIGRVTD